MNGDLKRTRQSVGLPSRALAWSFSCKDNQSFNQRCLVVVSSSEQASLKCR